MTGLWEEPGGEPTFINWNGQTGTRDGIWCLTRRACCRRWSPGPFPDCPQREMGAQGKLTGPVDPQGKRDAVSNAADCQMSRSGVTGTRLLESASLPRCPLPTADEARRSAGRACVVRRRGVVTAMSCAMLRCAAMRSLPFRVVTSLALACQSHAWRQHFRLRLTAPRQMTLRGRILEADIVHFLPHASGTVPPRTRAPGAGPNYWIKKPR